MSLIDKNNWRIFLGQFSFTTSYTRLATVRQYMFNGGILALTKRGTALFLQFTKNINLSTRFCKSKSLLRSVLEACPQAIIP